MPVPPDPRLQLTQPDGRVHWWLLLLATLLPTTIATIAIVVAASRMPREILHGIVDADPATLRLAGPAVVAAFTLAVWGVHACALRRHRIELDAGQLRVCTTFHTERIALSDLRLDAARVLALGEYPRYRPLLKTRGFSLPGFRSGWFRTRGFDKAFVAITDGRRVLWLPTTRGYALLLQPNDPRALLERLRMLVPAVATTA